MGARHGAVMVGLVVATLIPLGCARWAGKSAGGVSQTRAAPFASPRHTVNFNRDWKFARGGQQGAEKPDFDDADWQPVRLPHDWAISGPFDPNENGYAGKLPWRGEGAASIRPW